MIFDKEDIEFLNNRYWKLGSSKLLIQISAIQSLVDGNDFQHYEIFEALRNNPELRAPNTTIFTYLVDKYPEHFV